MMKSRRTANPRVRRHNPHLSAMTLGDLGQFANSSFATSLVGAIAGAFAGAYVAQRVAERAKLRYELALEVRHVNAALGLAFGIANSAIATKSQHVLPLKQAYEDEKRRQEAWIASVLPPQPTNPRSIAPRESSGPFQRSQPQSPLYRILSTPVSTSSGGRSILLSP